MLDGLDLSSSSTDASSDYKRPNYGRLVGRRLRREMSRVDGDIRELKASLCTSCRARVHGTCALMKRAFRERSGLSARHRGKLFIQRSGRTLIWIRLSMDQSPMRASSRPCGRCASLCLSHDLLNNCSCYVSCRLYGCPDNISAAVQRFASTGRTSGASSLRL
jgi:hypothetical protein